jgi:hypothetical protein
LKDFLRISHYSFSLIRDENDLNDLLLLFYGDGDDVFLLLRLLIPLIVFIPLGLF